MFLANILGPDGVIVLVIIVLVLLFGGTQLPKLARGLGEASHEFKKGQKETEDPARADAAKAEVARADAAKAEVTQAPADDKITLTKAELDALLAEREAKARRESESPPPA
jgi:sec-independent protein translocase protein TatA